MLMRCLFCGGVSTNFVADCRQESWITRPQEKWKSVVMEKKII